MGKLKIKKSDVWIDMTPMSDVMVLLLTFFMLTSTFVKQETVKVNQPKSISEIDIPEQNLLTIHIDTLGQVFMSTSDQKAQLEALKGMMAIHKNVKPDSLLRDKFKIDPMWGVPMSKLEAYLQSNSMSDEIKKLGGIPLTGVHYSDTINHVVDKKSEFMEWVECTKAAYKKVIDNNKDLTDEEKAQKKSDMKFAIAIKADANSKYDKVKEVLNQLQDIHESRYFLITNLKKKMED